MVKEMSAVDAAYLAGIIDGEGTVRLSHVRTDQAKMHHRTAHVTVANTRIELMHWIVERTGAGKFTRAQREPPNKPCYSWRIGSGEIRLLLPQIVPYMVLKQRQAQLVLRYLDLRQGKPAMTDEQMDEVLTICAEIAMLNSQGIHEERDRELQEWYGKKQCAEEGCIRWCYPNQDYCYRHWVARRVARIEPCLQCGKEMQVFYQKRKLYCSMECKGKHWHQTKNIPAAQAEVATRVAHPCPTCGNPVDRTHYARKVYCDDHCRESMRARHKKRSADFRIERVCEICSTPFSTREGKQIHCSSACRNKAYRLRQKEA